MATQINNQMGYKPLPQNGLLNAPTNFSNPALGTSTASLLTSALPKSLSPTPQGTAPIASGIGTIPGLVSPHITLGSLPMNPGDTHKVSTDGQGGTTSTYTVGKPDSTAPATLQSTENTDGNYTLGQNPTPQTSPSPFNTAVGGLLNAPGQNSTIGQNAADIAARYGKQIADVGQQGAMGEAGQLTTGTSPVAEGNAAVTQQTTAARQQALATGEQAALTGTGQQLTAQNQEQNALNNAGQLSQPNLGSIGQVPYSPTDLSQGSPLGAPGGTAADAARVQGGFNGAVAAAAAPGQTQAQNTITGGTAAVNAGNTAYQNANPAYLNLKNNIIPNIDSFGQLLTQGAGGVNPFDAQFANLTLQQFQNQLSSPQQAAFNATFQQLQKSIAALAGQGGTQTPTANSAQADATLSPTAKMSTIQSTLQRIAQEGNVYLTNQGNLSNEALNQAQGGNTNANSNSLYSF